MKTVIVFIVLADVTLSTADFMNCPVHLPRTNKLHQFGGSCYEFHMGINDHMTWRYADQDCHDKGGRLADIHSQAEQNFIINTSKAVRNPMYDDKRLWLALNDFSTEGKWSWSQGKTEIDFNNWAPSQPGNAGNAKEEENCGLMQLSGEWHAFPCTDMNGWICEFGTASNNNCPKRLPRTYNLLQWRDHCYLFILHMLEDWDEAQRHCGKHGGYLVDIHSHDEQDFIYWTWTKLKPVFIGTLGLWIGLTDVQNEGQWNWTSNEKILDYQNWNPGQPGSPGDLEDCALMSWIDSGKWHDYPCKLGNEAPYLYGWICEFH